jgi:peptidoglycan hydrolase CwlO-like protein
MEYALHYLGVRIEGLIMKFLILVSLVLSLNTQVFADSDSDEGQQDSGGTNWQARIDEQDAHIKDTYQKMKDNSERLNLELPTGSQPYFPRNYSK